MTTSFAYEKDADGVVTVTMDMEGSVNSMTDEYRDSMEAAVERLEVETGLTGVIIASAKKVFFAGGNLHDLLAISPEHREHFMEVSARTKNQLRRLEKLPVPVVAAINGAALGGGLEICLACNRRIAWNDKSVQIGFPEVTLGLLPGAGGVVRMVHLLGLEKALPHLVEGKRLSPDKALAQGIVHETVETLDELLPRAKAWILENRGEAAAATQPWDVKGHKIPGGKADSPHVAQMLVMASTMLGQRTRGLLPAPEEILDCAAQVTRLDFDTALRVESRGLLRLALTPQAKNMISTFFFGMNKVNSGASRPKGIEKRAVQKLGVLGAGLMGQGIAYVSAMSGIEVVLRDVSLEAAEKGKAYTEGLLAKRVSRGRMDEAKKQQVLERIRPTADAQDLAGCDLIVEAVFENIDLKHRVTRECEPLLAADGVWGSNTSSLPISKLAEASAAPERFIGIHFFSPVDKMPLVEIICGEKTDDETLARAFDYAQQIRKTPIVVNDSLGFYTSRTIGTCIDEASRLLVEGVHPVRLDNLGKAIGLPVGPLTLHDEVGIELSRKMMETWDNMGLVDIWGEQRVTRELVATMVTENGRGGRRHGGGFYEYLPDGSKHIWPKLLELYHKPDYDLPDSEIKDRLLFRPVIESLKCLETNVLRSAADGNIGSIMGIGAPTWTGGYIQFVNTYGLKEFSERCAQLAAAYGERFQAPAIVAEKLAAGEQFD